MAQKSSSNQFHDRFHKLQSDVKGFNKLSVHLKQLAGVDLPPSPKNLSLMASRLNKWMLEFGLSSYTELIKSLEEGNRQIEERFVASLTTHTTHFYREAKHFEIFQELLKSQMQNRPTELRIWCNAASTGQEPYTILFSCLQILKDFPSVSLKFLASDIDIQSLQKAQSALYSEAELEKVPKDVLQSFFEPVKGSGWRVQNRFRNLIRFSEFNLMSFPYPFQHKFDYIFCRNVLIYFEAPTSERVVEEMSKFLKPGGTLFLGHSESGFMKTKNLKTLAHAVYRRG